MGKNNPGLCELIPIVKEQKIINLRKVILLDNSVEGVECVEDKILGVQFQPESAPGPQDSTYLFDKFINMIKE